MSMVERISLFGLSIIRVPRSSSMSQDMSILSLFYRWAIEEGYASAEPFTYRSARAIFAGTGRDVRVNLAVRRTPKPHVTIKYLEPDFIELLRKGLRGLAPDGTADTGFSGREMTRNAAIGDLAVLSGFRLRRPDLGCDGSCDVRI
jgi:hypothetical protein